MARKTELFPAAPAEPDWPYDRCRVSSGEHRCFFPGTTYPHPSAKRGTGTCRLHDRAWRAEMALEVIQLSEVWYHDRAAGRDVPNQYRLSNGMTLAGYPSREQIERAALDKLMNEPAVNWGHGGRVREPGSDDDEPVTLS